VLRPRGVDEDVLDLAGNDYLGLGSDLRVKAAAASAALAWGAGSTGSRLVTGTTDLHTELEKKLAEFCEAPAGLVFSSGYLANLGVLTALGGPDVTIVSDAGNHASLIDGCKLSGSQVDVVPHRDLEKFEAALSQADTEHLVVVTDAVFSVDGDLADLGALHRIVRRHGAILIVDEAHSLGVVGDAGRGAAVAAGLAMEPDVVRTITLSKALGAQGGAVLAGQEIVDLLVNTARPFIFDTALAPPSAGAALEALRILRAEPGRVAAVRTNAQALAAILMGLGLEVGRPDAAVVSASLGDPLRATQAAVACRDAGMRVGCFRPPSVPRGRSCLRLTSRADLTAADLAFAEQVLTDVLSTPRTSAPSVHTRAHDLLEVARVQVLEQGIGLSQAQALEVLSLPDERVDELLDLAHEVRIKWCGDEVEVEGIVSLKTGGCPEDCHFCSQSGVFDSPVRSAWLDIPSLVKAAQETAATGASEFCIVAAVRGPDERLMAQVREGIAAINAVVDINVACSLGMLTQEQVEELAAMGVHRYNHNLETAESYFGSVVTTHSFAERVDTCQMVRKAGMELCCGGILGMGESIEQRAEFAAQLAALEPDEVPLNFLNPRPGTPFGEQEPMTSVDALRAVAAFRLVMPRTVLRFAGGREITLGDLAERGIRGGVNAVIVGNYLTTLGRPADQDLAMLADLKMPIKALARDL
jgi:biotin synthase